MQNTCCTPSHIHHYLRVFFAVLFVSLAVAILSPEPFRGTWQQSGGDNDEAWQLTTRYQFHRYHENGYPPREVSGWYWITRHDGDTYTIEIWIPTKSGNPGYITHQTIRLVDDATITINGNTAWRQ